MTREQLATKILQTAKSISRGSAGYTVDQALEALKIAELNALNETLTSIDKSANEIQNQMP